MALVERCSRCAAAVTRRCGARASIEREVMVLAGAVPGVLTTRAAAVVAQLQEREAAAAARELQVGALGREAQEAETAAGVAAGRGEDALHRGGLEQGPGAEPARRRRGGGGARGRRRRREVALDGLDRADRGLGRVVPGRVGEPAADRERDDEERDEEEAGELVGDVPAAGDAIGARGRRGQRGEDRGRRGGRAAGAQRVAAAQARGGGGRGRGAVVLDEVAEGVALGHASENGRGGARLRGPGRAVADAAGCDDSRRRASA